MSDRISQLSASNVSLIGFATCGRYRARKLLRHVFSRNLAVFASMLNYINLSPNELVAFPSDGFLELE